MGMTSVDRRELLLRRSGTSMGGRIMSANSLTSQPVRLARDNRAAAASAQARSGSGDGVESGTGDHQIRGGGASEPKIGMDSPHLEITVGGQTRELPINTPAVTV